MTGFQIFLMVSGLSSGFKRFGVNQIERGIGSGSFVLTVIVPFYSDFKFSRHTDIGIISGFGSNGIHDERHATK